MCGNQVLCTCTMIRWPRLKVWWIDGISNLMLSARLATIGDGISNDRRYLARNGSPRTSC